MADKPKLDLFLQARSGSSPGRLNTSDQKALDQVLAYDPDARFVTEGAGGEGGGEQTYIAYDESKLPAFKGDLNRVIGVQNQKLRAKSKVVQDDVYGAWTSPENIVKDKDPAWVKFAPLAVTLAAPYLGGLAMAGGIGLGAAGTAAVTGGAAGLAAGNIASGGTASFLSNIASKAPQIARGQGDNFNPLNLLGDIAGASGVPYAALAKPALALAGSALTRGTAPATTPKQIDPRIALLLALAGKRGR